MEDPTILGMSFAYVFLYVLVCLGVWCCVCKGDRRECASDVRASVGAKLCSRKCKNNMCYDFVPDLGVNLLN